MFKKNNSINSIILVLLMLLLVFSQITQPINSINITYALENISKPILYLTKDEIKLEKGLIIKEDTYLYGTPEGEDVSVQYSDTNTTISLDLLEEVDKNEKNFIKFHELDNQYVIKNLVKDTAFYSIEPDDKERIILTEDVAYPVYENDLGLEVVYVGNTEYYLSEEDRITALESYEDKDGNREFNEAKDNNKKNIKAEFSSDEEINKDIIDVIPNNVPNKSHFSQDRYIEESKDNDKNEKDEKSEQEQDGSISWKDVKYFKVTTDNLVVNERKNGKLEPVGKLKKDQVYPRVRDYGNWHEITIGNTKGYVWKADTIPANKDDINNENKDYKNQSLIFTTLQDVTIYDNSSGELTPFGVIDKGQSYPIASDYGNWWRIIFSDRIGYVKKSEVALSFTNSDKYFKTLTNLPIYDNRTGKLVKVGELPRGQVYPRVSDYGNWHRIKFGDIYGYVRKADTIPANGTEIRNVNSNYKNLPRTFTPLKNVIVYDNTSGNLVPFGTIDKDVSYPIVGDYGNWWRIILSDRIGYVSKKDVKTDFIVSDKYFRAETNLPIYDNRTGKLVKIGEIQKGQVYPRVSDYGNWHRIQFGEIYGYVNKSETTPANGNEIKNMNNTYKFQSRTIIPKNNVIVYDNTSGKLVPFGTIEKGIEYPLVSDYGNWWRIVYADRVGYVSKSDVNLGFVASDKYFRAETNLPIYDNRSGKLEKVGEVLQGQVYPRVSDYGNWHRIQFGKIYGYVSKSGTVPNNGNGLNNINEIYTHSDVIIQSIEKTIIYDNTSGKLVPFGTLEKGIDYPTASLYDYGNWWRIIYAGRVGYINKNNVQLLGRYSYTNYGITLNQAVDIQWNQGNYNPKNITKNTLRYYMDIDNFINDPIRRFQFLNLTKPIGISISAMNNYLNGRGTLSGQGKAFAEASKKSQINELYLISHAILETGHGTSKLASGIEVGKDNKGNLVLVDNNNRKNLKDIKTTYNMFGIGAYDSCPDSCGAIKAYEHGWDTPYKAIVGGAEWIKNDYLYNQHNQNTLYKMRWNPRMDSGFAWKQYATDIGWAYKQSKLIYDMYEAIGIEKSKVLDFDVPVYK